METKKLNIFILNKNTEAAGKLRRHIKSRFDNTLNVSLFTNNQTYTDIMNGNGHLVVIEDYLYEWGSKESNRVKLLQTIQEKSPDTVVVILKSNADLGKSIEAMQQGENATIIKKIGTWQRVQNVVDQTVGQPIKYMVAEFGIKKYMKVFFF